MRLRSEERLMRQCDSPREGGREERREQVLESDSCHSYRQNYRHSYSDLEGISAQVDTAAGQCGAAESWSSQGLKASRLFPDSCICTRTSRI